MKRLQQVKGKALPDLPRPTHSYVGRKQCGCAIVVTIDFNDKTTAKAVQMMIESGLTIDRVPFGTSEYSDLVHNLGCDCEEHQG